MIRAKKENSSSILKKNTPQKFNFKVALLGDEGVGKTRLFRTYIEKSFKQDYKSTIGVSVINKTYEFPDNISVTLNFWDLVGQKEFKDIRKTYLEGTQTAILVYDVTDSKSFDSIPNWLDELQQPMKSQSKFAVMLIGNKTDTRRRVSFEEAKNFAIKKNMAYFETSTLTGNNLEEALKALCYYLIYNKDWLNESIFFKENAYKPKIIQVQDLKLENFHTLVQFSANDWPKRLLEEKAKIEQLLNYYRKSNISLSIIKIEFDERNSRLLHCTLQLLLNKPQKPIFIDFKIRLPLRYPYVPPKATDFKPFNFIEKHYDYKRWDNDDPAFVGFRFACLGQLEKRWNRDGSMGIAHYIKMLFFYFTLDHFSYKL